MERNIAVDIQHGEVRDQKPWGVNKIVEELKQPIYEP